MTAPKMKALDTMKKKGRGGDTEVGHLTIDEIVVPPRVRALPGVDKALRAGFATAGLDIGRYTVGGADDSRNPETGAREFFSEGDAESAPSSPSDPSPDSRDSMAALGGPGPAADPDPTGGRDPGLSLGPMEGRPEAGRDQRGEGARSSEQAEEKYGERGFMDRMAAGWRDFNLRHAEVPEAALRAAMKAASPVKATVTGMLSTPARGLAAALGFGEAPTPKEAVDKFVDTVTLGLAPLGEKVADLAERHGLSVDRGAKPGDPEGSGRSEPGIAGMPGIVPTSSTPVSSAASSTPITASPMQQTMSPRMAIPAGNLGAGGSVDIRTLLAMLSRRPAMPGFS